MLNQVVMHALQYLGYVLEIALVFVIFRGKRWKDLTAFSLYVISFVLVDVALRPATLNFYGLRSKQYSLCYWYSDIALTLAAFVLVCFFFRRACSGNKGYWSFLRTFLAVVFLGIAVVSYMSISEHYGHLIGRYIVDLQQNLYFACLVLTSILYVIIQNNDAPSEEFSLLVCGLGIEFAGPAAGMALAYLTPGGHDAGIVASYVIQICNLGMFATWLYALSIKHGEAGPRSPWGRDEKKVPAFAGVTAEVKEVQYV